MDLNEMLRIFDGLVVQQQWTDHDLHISGRGRITLDKFSELSMRIDTLKNNSSKINK
jgi:hypothetical protein